MSLSTIEDAVKRIRRGEMVLVVDDEDRENEGDLTMAASWVTPEAINFMLRWARGLVCMPSAPSVLDALELAPMVPPGRAGCDTAFTVSIDHVDAGSGIGAGDRALTISRALAPGAHPGEFIRPGHVFPLRARPGGTPRATRAHRSRRRPRPPCRSATGRRDLRGACGGRLAGSLRRPVRVRRAAPHRDGRRRPGRRAPHRSRAIARSAAPVTGFRRPGCSPISRSAAAIAARSLRAVSGARCATIPRPPRPDSSRVSTTRSSPSPHASQSSVSATAHDAGGRSSSPSG